MTAIARLTPSSLGFLRVAAISPELRVADVAFNTAQIVAALETAAAQGCRLALFPELALTSYSCADLFYQTTLLDQARLALSELARATALENMAAVVGLPLVVQGRLYNCAALLSEGRLCGIVPKSYLPTTNEFYEQRWFTSALAGTPPTVKIDERRDSLRHRFCSSRRATSLAWRWASRFAKTCGR